MSGKSKLSNLEEFYSGSITGVISRFFVAPLDVVKIRLQTQNIRYGKLKYQGTYSTIMQIAREEGISHLWTGNWTAEVYWFLYSGIQFSCYQALQNRQSDIVKSSFASGAISSMVTTLATYPFDIMRTRFIFQGENIKYKHIGSGIVSIVREEGITGLYKGLLPCVISIVPYMGSCFYMMELLKKRFGDSPGKNSLYGAFSGAISKIIVYPLDTGKKLLQVYRISASDYTAWKFVGKQFTSTGVRGLYAGLVAATLKSALSSSLLFGIYAFMQDIFRDHKNILNVY